MNPTQQHHVIFDTSSAKPTSSKNPVIILISFFCGLWLKMSGWKIQGDWPDIKKVVLVAAPHTSNWDAINMLVAAGYYRIRLNWMGKKTLTTGPFGWVVKSLGCIPIDRSSKQNTVEQISKVFADRDAMVLAISPEGTRASTSKWKTGFYHIAFSAGVPIMMTVQDYGSKTIRLSGILTPSGNYDDDITLIKTHYKDAHGKYDGQFTNTD